MTEYISLLQRILQGQVEDIRIPKENIGEGKDFQWRSSSRNGEPILIHNASGTAVSGAGINLAQSKIWVKPKQEKPNLEYVDSIPNGIHKGQPGVKYITKNGDVSYMSVKLFSEKELQQIKGYSQQSLKTPPPPPKPQNVLIQKIEEPSFQKYKDFQDAYTNLQKEGHELEGFEKLQNFPWKHMSTVIDSMRTFAQEFPEYKLNLGISKAIPTTSSICFSVLGALLPQDLLTPTILSFFKPKMTTDKQNFKYNPKYFEREETISPERGHHPPNETVAAMIYHELWHALGNEMIRKAYDKKCRVLRQHATDYEFASYYLTLKNQREKLSYAICKEASMQLGKFKSQRSLKKNAALISEYATIENDETIAEAFDDVFANGENAAEYSRLIYKIAKKYATMSAAELQGEINNV